MTNKMKFKIVIFLAMMVMAWMPISCTRPAHIKALVLTGQNIHNWQNSSLILKHVLEETGLFEVTVLTSPGTGQDMTGFVVDFSPYDLVVLDYTGDDWPDATRDNFVSYVNNGGGVVVYHGANNAFPDWPEYNEIIGLGGWGNRNESAGPYVYIKDGDVVRDLSPGRGGSHGPQHEFVVQAYQPGHPILKGLPERWLHAKDELYSELRGPAKNLEILAFAHADKKFKGTGRDEPMLMTITYGKGRIFHTVLGHAGRNDDYFPALECAGFVVTFQRGAEWAATGRMTQRAPDAFPTEAKIVKWGSYRDVFANK
jgi:uncharacterized protein